MGLYSNILVAYDGSEKSKEAIVVGKKLAELDSDIKLQILTVWDIPEQHVSIYYSNYSEMKELFHQSAVTLKEDAEAMVNELGEQVKGNIVEGDPAYQIVEFAKNQDIDLIIIGSRGLSGVKKWFLGGVSNRVVQHAHCAVHVVK